MTRKMKRTTILLLLFTAFLLAACTPQQKECTTDSDCVPNKCCHATACIPKEKAPNCEGVFCTAECMPNTLDCNQGKCVCKNNKCQVEWLK